MATEVVKLHKWLILEMQVWGGSKIAYRQDCQQFSAIYPKFLLSCSELLHSEGRQEWSHALGRSKSLWEVHQVHLQARLHNLSLKNREKKMHLTSFDCVLKDSPVPSHLRMETFWSGDSKTSYVCQNFTPPAWFFPLLLHSSWNSVCFICPRWETTAWNVLRIKGKAEKNTGDRVTAA